MTPLISNPPLINSILSSLAPRGTVHSFTVVRYPANPALADAVPYTVVLVSLDDAPHLRVVGNIEGDVQIGMPVVPYWEDRTAADGTVQIVLMSVYTPQARAAAGGTTQIQAQIQAAVDQANTAFVNSNMIARYFLAHTEEVAYNDSGNIETGTKTILQDIKVFAINDQTSPPDEKSAVARNGWQDAG